MITAHARKLLVALWKYANANIKSEIATIKQPDVSAQFPNLPRCDHPRQIQVGDRFTTWLETAVLQICLALLNLDRRKMDIGAAVMDGDRM